jgi:hypothetical protein
VLVRQVEQYHLVRAGAEEITLAGATATDNIQEWRWWTLTEVQTTDQTVYPLELPDLVAALLAQGAPDSPRTLR